MQRIPGLAFYHMVEKPRLLDYNEDGECIEEGKNDSISIKTFKDLFMCSICFNILKEPVAVRNCLHKFCQQCLEELHRTSKQCPQCRTQIASRRVWRPDSKFSEILKILIDDID